MVFLAIWTLLGIPNEPPKKCEMPADIRVVARRVELRPAFMPPT